MNITLNGEDRKVDDGISVLQLVMTLGVKPRAVVVERNAEIVEHDDYDKTMLNDGDEIEVVAIVGGG